MKKLITTFVLLSLVIVSNAQDVETAARLITRRNLVENFIFLKDKSAITLYTPNEYKSLGQAAQQIINTDNELIGELESVIDANQNLLQANQLLENEIRQLRDRVSAPQPPPVTAIPTPSPNTDPPASSIATSEEKEKGLWEMAMENKWYIALALLFGYWKRDKLKDFF